MAKMDGKTGTAAAGGAGESINVLKTVAPLELDVRTCRGGLYRPEFARFARTSSGWQAA